MHATVWLPMGAGQQIMDFIILTVYVLKSLVCCFINIQLFRVITHHRFGLQSPNLRQTCILWYSQLVLKMEVIGLDLQDHFGHFDTEFLRNLTCPRYNFQWISVRITKFASWDFPSWYWKWEALTLTFMVIWPFRLTRRHSTSPLYTDLGWPRGATCPKHALVGLYDVLITCMTSITNDSISIRKSQDFLWTMSVPGTWSN